MPVREADYLQQFGEQNSHSHLMAGFGKTKYDYSEKNKRPNFLVFDGSLDQQTS